MIGRQGKRASGCAEILDPDGPRWVHDTVTCGHCQAVIFTVPGTLSMQYLIYDPIMRIWSIESGAFCRSCMSPVCLPCHAIGTCTPWEQTMERMEHAARGR